MTNFTAHDSSTGKILYQGWTPSEPKRMTQAEAEAAQAELFKEYSLIVLDRIETRCTIRAGWKNRDYAHLTTTLYLACEDDKIVLCHSERLGNAMIAYQNDEGDWVYFPSWRQHALAFCDFCTRSQAGERFPGRANLEAHQRGEQ